MSNRLEDHLVGLVARSEAEGGAEVGDEERLLLEAGEDGTVNGLLVLGAAGGDLLGLKGLYQYFGMSQCSWLRSDRTSGFSPCLKKASSPLAFDFFSLAK